MSRATEPEENDLAAALVAAFPSYIQQRLGMVGVDIDGELDAVVATTVGDLAGALQALASVPPQSQVRSPLELVREATIPITSVLSSRGVAAPDRDEWAVAAHPEDVYDLYPASSRELSEEAWQLHLAWGIEKARLVAGVVPASPEHAPSEASRLPAVALFGIEQVRRDTLIAAFMERGYRGLVWRNPAALETTESPEVVFVDLRHPKAHDAIRSLKSAGTRVVAVADQVNDLAVPGIMALGAEEVLELSRVVAQLDRLLPRIA